MTVTDIRPQQEGSEFPEFYDHAKWERRPAWQTKPCPAWCVEPLHRDRDAYVDRQHYTEMIWIGLSAEDPPSLQYDDPAELEICMSQWYREVDPRIWVARRETLKGFHLTLDEAEDVAMQLLRFVVAGRGVDATENEAARRYLEIADRP